MPYITISSGLTIKIPTRTSTNWDEELRTNLFGKISAHDHTGSGNGIQIATAAIADDAVNDVKIRLRNAQYLRSRNAAGSGDVNILRVGTDDKLEIVGGSVHSVKAFSLSNNQSSAASITDLIFASAKAKAAVVSYHIFRDATTDVSETGILELKYNGSSWDFSQEKSGNAGIVFSVNSSGQVQYTSSDLAGHSASTVYWFAQTLGV